MTTNQYLWKILEEQELTTDQKDELDNLADEVETHLREQLPDVSMTIKRAGSKAKNTMVCESYDLDLVVYVHSGEEGAGKTLEEIFNRVRDELGKKYFTSQKTSAIRLMSTSGNYMHVDVVPGRFFDETKTDTWLHRTTGDKARLKTNLKVHIVAIRDSGVVSLIRLMKLWAKRNNISIPTFVLELLCVNVASDVKGKNLENQVVHVFEQFRDNVDELDVVDPANSNNGLTEALDSARTAIQSHATWALNYIDNDKWTSVFGTVKEEKARAVVSLAAAASAAPSMATKPWGCDDLN